MRRSIFGLVVLLGATELGGCKQGQAATAARADSTKTAAEVVTPAGGAQGTQHVKAPAQFRGIYLNAYGAGSKARLGKFFGIADSTEINTFVVDVKDENG